MCQAPVEFVMNDFAFLPTAQLQETCRNGGNVLVATDTGGRVLEMTHMLEQMWNTKESGLSAYSLAILSNTGYHVIHFAKQMVGCSRRILVSG